MSNLKFFNKRAAAVILSTALAGPVSAYAMDAEDNIQPHNDNNIQTSLVKQPEAALKTQDAASAFDLIKNRLKYGEEYERAAMVEMFPPFIHTYESHAEEAFDLLLDLADDENSYVREEVATALGDIRYSSTTQLERALSVLEKLSDDSYVETRNSVNDSYARLPVTAPEQKDMLFDKLAKASMTSEGIMPHYVRYRSTNALRTFSDNHPDYREESENILEQMLSDRTLIIRERSLEELIGMRTDDHGAAEAYAMTMPVLAAMAHDPSWQVRYGVLKHIKQAYEAGDEQTKRQSLTTMLNMTGDTDGMVVGYSKDALVSIASDNAESAAFILDNMGIIGSNDDSRKIRMRIMTDIALEHEEHRQQALNMATEYATSRYSSESLRSKAYRSLTHIALVDSLYAHQAIRTLYDAKDDRSKHVAETALLGIARLGAEHPDAAETAWRHVVSFYKNAAEEHDLDRRFDRATQELNRASESREPEVDRSLPQISTPAFD